VLADRIGRNAKDPPNVPVAFALTDPVHDLALSRGEIGPSSGGTVPGNLNELEFRGLSPRWRKASH
jgi:hypothetical protein